MQITKTKLETKKNIHKKIIHFSDIHFYKNYKEKKLQDIIELVEKQKPDYVCITGDLLDTPQVTKLTEIQNYLNFYKDLGKLSKVIVILGNHDLFENHQTTKEYDDFLNKLKQTNNIYLLRNEKTEFEDIVFVSYEQMRDTYKKEEKKTNQIEEDMIEKLPKASLEKYTVALIHSPITLIKIRKRSYLKNYDLFLCGHTHDGILPIFLSKNINIHYGIVSPTKKLFPKNIRGIYLDTPNIIINGGVVKFSKTAKILKKLDFLYPSSANIIEIDEKM